LEKQWGFNPSNPRSNSNTDWKPDKVKNGERRVVKRRKNGKQREKKRRNKRKREEKVRGKLFEFAS